MPIPVKRNAVSFLVDKVEFQAKAGAIECRYIDGVLWGIEFGCPCGCGYSCWLPFNVEGKKSGWNPESLDDLTKLTLTPSIGFMPDRKTGAFHWHGYLKNGVFEER